ncbi:MAG: hypothetical protein ABSC32_00485 [Steroidobacteraceae bacterium]|jgi:hypothetical protein
MTAAGEAQRDAIMARLSQSREEIARLLEPPSEAGNGETGSGPSGAAGGFPRSRIMRALMSGRGLGAVGAVAGGLLLARPGLAWRLIRLIPTSAVTRMVVGKVIGVMRGKSREP